MNEIIFVVEEAPEGGYVATVEFPFVAGKARPGQKRFLDALFEAATVQFELLRAGTVMGEMVRSVKAVFRKHRLTRFDVYPPMHGIGLAEAESPYPDAETKEVFRAGMCVNSDISLFGHLSGSNRIWQNSPNPFNPSTTIRFTVP
jgi:hypothetical protein